MVNLLNADGLHKSYGTRALLTGVSLGLARGDVVGVVGRNGDGKTTLLRLLTKAESPDSGQVTHHSGMTVGYLTQVDRPGEAAAAVSLRDHIVDGGADHTWAADRHTRGVVEDLVGNLPLDEPLSRLSGGERRRVDLARVLTSGHDLLVLDEPTNHLDVEAVAWLARHLNALASRGTAMLIVSHDRWFLDEVCSRIWEVHDGVVDSYDGGYAAYVLARAERQRIEAATEARRKNLVRKELAWLRRGPPARTSKPKFRIDAANALIADVPEPRDSLELKGFATTRLGKDVVDLVRVDADLPDGRVLLRDQSWAIGPGDRIGVVGVNGAGKTTLLRLLLGEYPATAGKVKQGRTLRVGHLSQAVDELPAAERVLESVESLKRETRLATGREASASTLLEDFGFTGDKLTTRVGDLSGGERRRLQFLRLLLAEPNILLLDEPTNDLDIDTLTVIEDYLDTWPGTLIVVSHDRWFLERTCDVVYGLMGDGRCVLLPRGVEQYLAHREAHRATPASPSSAAPAHRTAADPQVQRQAKKDLARIEGQLAKLGARIERLHAQMADAAADHVQLVTLQGELAAAEAELAPREEEWLDIAATLDS